MPSTSHHPRSDHRRAPPPDRVLVVASPGHAIELLRWATLRSDDVLFVAPVTNEPARRFASRYAIELRERPVADRDFAGVSALLLGLDDHDAENALIRRARRHGVLAHVRGRPLVSDFSVLAMMEQPWPVRLAA